MKTKSVSLIRQGEVLLVPVDGMKGEGKEVKDYVVSHSETGHHHIVMGLATIFQVKGRETVVKVEADTVLRHAKDYDAHKELAVPAGFYKVVKKTEYDPFADTIREIWD